MRRELLSTSLMLAGIALIAGCSSTPVGPEQAAAGVEDRTPGAVTPQAVAPPDSARVTPVTPEPQKGSPLAELRDPRSILSKRSVFFDYDDFTVRGEFNPLIEAHAKFLGGHQDIKMLIQGNTDERGSREYNLALGQKRADAVKRALMLMGAKEAAIETVSLGEEKPREACSEEHCWKENRRADMLYSGEF